ncbi:MAG: peptidylprolyl isomerase [Gammaproteobacteria bacterium]|nr:MAG: peptidylprolyl isomerase [Gammaproteobacteria bacterium]
MQIDKHSVVTLHYTLKDNDGNILDESSDGSFCYLHGENNIIPGLENALTGKVTGDELSVSVPPEEAYGLHDAERTQSVPRHMFPTEQTIEPGMQFHAEGPEGQSLLVTVVKADDDTVTVDGNHPLAGVQLNFDVKVIAVRDAEEEEITHGHVHGPGGHHH